MFHNKEHTKQTKMKNQKILHDKESNFWDWYLWILKVAQILDTNYSVKGCYIWLDYGFQLYNRIYSFAKEIYEKFGHKQMQFPTLIKEETFRKETNFIRDFEDDVFWVDRSGQKKLTDGERLALRPTSELIIYPSFARWIRSWRDLPLKIFQNVSIFRCETNETRPLIRNRETIGFIEGHSAFQTKEEALSFLEQIWLMYKQLFAKLGIPIILVDVPEWDRFSGSSLTIDGYVLFPGSKAMELFTSAYLGTTFSEIFNIQYVDIEKNKQHAHLLCYGPSIDRILASVIALYGDNHGLVLQSNLSPFDFALVSIYNRKNTEEIKQYTSEICSKLTKIGFNILLDQDNNKTPGAKFYEMERYGIPYRIEIGQNEYSHRNLTLTRRDNFEKVRLKFDSKSLKKNLRNLLKEYDETIKQHTTEKFNKSLISITSYNHLEILVNSNQLQKDKMYLFGWCGSLECAETLETLTNFTILGYNHKTKNNEQLCMLCKNKGKEAILAKRY
ncbi:MAG: proline--tRNA ligase [Asgard group archaeon]|nr:proline--tRNA ligase [Asgard group archaeon]